MKVKVEVDATPQELRTFFGLPDVEPMQKELMETVRNNMVKGLEQYDPMTLMKLYLPPNMPSLDAMQKSFWNALAHGLKRGDGGSGSSSGGSGGT